mgnify:CR=1 FL=1
MENNYNNNELDRWLREQAEADGWDQPSEQVWTNLRAGLDARRKRRLWFWLFVFALGAGLLGGGIGYRHWHKSETIPAVQNGPVAGTESGAGKTRAAAEPPETSADFEISSNSRNLPSAEKNSRTPDTRTLPQVAESGTNHTTQNTQAARQSTAQTNTHTNTTKPAVRDWAGNQAARTAPQNLPTHASEIVPNTAVQAAEPEHNLPGTNTAPAPPDTPVSIAETAPEETQAIPPVALLPRIQPARLSVPQRPEPVSMALPPIVKKTPENGWYAGAVAGMFFTGRRIKSESGQQPN